MTDHTPEPDSVREAFERWYVENAFNYARDPIGSHRCGLQRPAYYAAHAAAQSRIASLEAERDEWKSIAEHNLSRRLSALEERNAAVTARDEALARVASLEQAASGLKD